MLNGRKPQYHTSNVCFACLVIPDKNYGISSSKLYKSYHTTGTIYIHTTIIHTMYVCTYVNTIIQTGTTPLIRARLFSCWFVGKANPRQVKWRQARLFGLMQINLNLDLKHVNYTSTTL